MGKIFLKIFPDFRGQQLCSKASFFCEQEKYRSWIKEVLTVNYRRFAPRQGSDELLTCPHP
jgi:hypothetical protein